MIQRTLHAVFLTIVVSTILSLPSAHAQNIELLTTYPSDPNVFTQGLEVSSTDHLIISSGRYNESIIAILDLTTGIIDVKDTLDAHTFGEGFTITEDVIWQLTYKEHTAYKRDKTTFDVLDTVTYEGEGWGIAYDDTHDVLWMTDGSATLQKRDPRTFELLDTIDITYRNQPIERLNELESVDGILYGNIWQTHYIVALNPLNGVITQVYDAGAILDELNLDKAHYDTIDVLNGIAHISDDMFYITGKNYPLVLKVRLSK